jgi:Putative metallopeptidase
LDSCCNHVEWPGMTCKSHSRLIPHLILILLLVFPCRPGTALAQSRATDSSELQARIDEAARALTNNPRLKSLSPQKVQAVTEFVAGNMLFVLLHELGHTLVSEMELPVLGREEDAADAFATLEMLKMGTSFSHRVLVEAAEGWFLSDLSDQEQGESISYYDQHELNKQRAYQIVCFMVGANPQMFKDLADETKLPESRQETCPVDYNNALWSWNKVLEFHRRSPNQPKQNIAVSYEPGEGMLDLFAQASRSIQLLEPVAEQAADQFVWRAPFAITMRTCGQSNAHWKFQAREIELCYEVASDFAQLYRDYGNKIMLRAK